MLVAMTGVLAISIALLVFNAYFATLNTLTNELEDALSREAEAYGAAVASAPSATDLAEATRTYFEGRAGGGSGLDAVLLAAFDNGRTISNSSLRLEDAPDNLWIADPPPQPVFGEVTLEGTPYRVLSVAIVSRGETVGVFQAAVDVTAVEATARRIAMTLAAAGLISLGLGLPLAYWATGRSLAPLTRMAKDAAEISHAQPGRRIAYNGPEDELGSLADSLNEMLGRLERSYDDQRQFVADASHELRTPVAVIRGNVELLRSGHAEGAERDTSLRMIETEAVRMTRLLDELLALARLESTGRRQFQPLEVSTLLEEAAARGRALGGRTFVLAPTCEIWVRGDPDLLEQVIGNLVRNAVAHTADGGHIELGCSTAGGSARLTITDDGPGIAEEHLDRVFDRFHRAPGERPEESGGAGLGLAIAKRLVELHGGAIHAENATPHGARFIVDLPRIDPPG